ncbi:MAG: hypothetical protein LBT00_00800 [Spirochaetaceae bacterium]|nr:hypothetical protein [Spirochaetaceae bacterium]
MNAGKSSLRGRSPKQSRRGKAITPDCFVVGKLLPSRHDDRLASGPGRPRPQIEKTALPVRGGPFPLPAPALMPGRGLVTS